MEAAVKNLYLLFALTLFASGSSVNVRAEPMESKLRSFVCEYDQPDPNGSKLIFHTKLVVSLEPSTRIRMNFERVCLLNGSVQNPCYFAQKEKFEGVFTHIRNSQMTKTWLWETTDTFYAMVPYGVSFGDGGPPTFSVSDNGSVTQSLDSGPVPCVATP